MITDGDKPINEAQNAVTVNRSDEQPLAGPSTGAIPRYEDVVDTSPPPFQAQQAPMDPPLPVGGHVLIDFSGADVIPAGGEEPPPAFTTYDAEFSIDSSGTVLSHDDHLNTDGEALYRFLLTHASTPPNYTLHISGTHEETHTRLVSRTDSKGYVKQETEMYTETVTDFDFNIDVGQQILSVVERPPVHWSVPDEQPAYRGHMVRDVGIPNVSLRHATKQEMKIDRKWAEERTEHGLPPWVASYRQSVAESRPEGGAAAYDVLQSSWTLRQWADDYCASEKMLKEFVYEKVIYGWDTATLTSAIRAVILSTHYRGRVNVSFKLSSSRIVVRSSNRLSRALSKTWVKVLLFLTLIYPFIALFRRFHRRGGGRWEVCGGAYALKAWTDAPPDALAAATATAGEPARASRIVKTPHGVKMLLGEPEGEWFRRWQGTIRNAVLGRRQHAPPLIQPDGDEGWNPAAEALDGFRSPPAVPYSGYSSLQTGS